MDIRITPRTLRGTVRAIPSKSEAHRALILAALSSEKTLITGIGQTAQDGGHELSNDILRTADALRSLGAGIDIRADSIVVTPCEKHAGRATIDCGDSGSTLRFMVPVCAALGGEFRFIRRLRLPKRPLTVLTEQLTAHGLSFSEDGDDLLMSGKLTPGEFTLPGNESSQYITGLLLALPLVGDSVLRITGELESRPYVDITVDLLRKFGMEIRETHGDALSFEIGRCEFSPVGEIAVGGDWSCAANILCVGASVSGLDRRSCQGDRGILDILENMGATVCESADGALSLDMSNGLSAIDVDMRDMPDIIPLVAVMCTTARGTSVIRNVRRLRLKESDRVKSTLALIHALGGRAVATDNEITVEGSAALVEGSTPVESTAPVDDSAPVESPAPVGSSALQSGCAPLCGGEVDSFADHRIAMAGAVASCFADGDVTVKGAQHVAKSYPGFWEEIRSLGAELTEI